MQLLIDGMTVTVIRKPIKNMNLRVLPPDGVIQITAPARLPQENIARFVREKRSWIERRQQILAARPAPTCPDFSDGQTVYLWEKAAVFVWNQLRGDETPSFAIRTSFCRSIRAIRPHSGRRF